MRHASQLAREIRELAAETHRIGNQEQELLREAALKLTEQKRSIDLLMAQLVDVEVLFLKTTAEIVGCRKGIQDGE